MPESPPLAGIKVVDFTRYLAGPFCTQILGDYGAEILKVEPVEGARGEMGDESGKDTYFFLSTNRSKKSIQVSTKSAGGARGAATADRRRRRRHRQLPAGRDGSDRVRLRADRGAQSAHHCLQHFGLRRDRSDARLSGLRPNRAGVFRPDECDWDRGERSDPRRHRDLRFAREASMRPRGFCSRSRRVIAPVAGSASRPRCSKRSSVR